MNFGGTRNLARGEEHQGLNALVAQEDAQGATGQGEHYTLSEELADQTSAAGPQSGTHGDFFLARGGARQQEISDVGTGDQQNESHRSHEHQHPSADPSPQTILPGPVQAPPPLL